MAGLFFSLLLLTSSGYAADSSSGPAELLPVVQAQAEALQAVSDNAVAVALFTTKIGPALGLHDVASTLAAKNIPPKVAKELGVQELTTSAQRLIANLAAWQSADRITQSLSEPASPVAAPPATLVNWIQAATPIPSLAQMTKDLTQLAEAKPDTAAADRMRLPCQGRLVSTPTAGIAEWWQPRPEDRVRQRDAKLQNLAMDYSQSPAASSGTEARFLPSSGA
jgi:hypothetical protein